MKRRDFMASAALAGMGAASGLRVAPVQAADGATGLAVAHRFSVGEVQVTALSDGFIPMTAEIFNGISEQGFAAALHDAFIDGATHNTGVNAFLVEIEGMRTLIDAGTGPSMGPGLGKLSANMAALGIEPESIDRLIATHLHPDHVGGAAVMDFAKAQLVVSQDDIDFWTNADIRAQAPSDFHPFFDLAKGVVDGFGERVHAVTGEEDLGAGMTTVPLPGHTPGHMGVRLESDGAQILFWADIVHVGAVQFANPEVTIAFDIDQDVARATRLKAMDMVATDRMMIAGAHIGFPGIGHVERAATGYRFQPAPWPYG